MSGVGTGLYDPAYEHDACGVAFVARLDAVPSHETVERALTAVANLEHRGAQGADALTGDGAGILTQLPDAFFRGVLDVELPPAGQYGVAVCFLPHDDAERARLERLLADTATRRGTDGARLARRPVRSRATPARRRARRPRASASSSSPPRPGSTRTPSSASCT